jgi:hypothetical protein
VDALARDGSSSPFLGTRPAISVSPCVGRLKVKEWLKVRHSEHMAAKQVQGSQSSSLEDPLINCLGTYWPWTANMQADNRVVNWSLCIEVAPTYHGPLRKCQGQEM